LRDEILSAVREMLIEEGYDSAVTLRGVARRVGIAAQSIYPHFNGPDEIVQAVTIATFSELGRAIADAKTGISDPHDRLLAGCRAYIRFGVDNVNLYGLLFRRNKLLRGQEAGPDTADEPDRRDPEAGPFAYLIDSVRQCIADGSSLATNEVLTATQLWAAMHGLVLLRGNNYQFPWPDLDALEIGLISSVAQLRSAS
jgi:AcrR family transcriptional regulator